MKKTTLLCIIISSCILTLSVTGCNSKQVKGSGNIVQHEVNIDIYNEIKVEGAIDIVYEAKPDEAPYLMAEADDNIIPLIEVKTKGGTLSVKSRESINPGRCTIYTNSPSLKYIETRGASKVHLKGSVAGTNFKLDLRGTSEVKADNLVYEQAEFQLRGVGKITLAGHLYKGKYSISGNGDIYAADLEADELECRIQGNGNMEVNASNKLEIDIRGNGDISYRGNPQITKQSIKGSGSVKVLK